MPKLAASRLADGWTRKPLNEVVSRVTQRNHTGETNALTISAKDGLVSQTDYFNRRVISDDARQYFLLQCGDFAYNKSYSIGHPVGVIRRLDRYERGIVSPLYICFRPNGNVDSNFLRHYFEAGSVDDQIAWVAKEGVRNHGLLNVGVGDFFSIDVDLPPLKEQQRVAEILDSLDESIRSTERLIVKRQSLRDGLLQEFFTRGVGPDGQLRPHHSDAPERYRRWGGGSIPREWVVRLLDQVAVRGSGHTPNREVPSYWDGGIKWVSLADSSKLDRIYITDTAKNISAAGIANSSAVVHPPETVILSRDAGVGKSAILADEMAVSQHFMAWRCGGELNPLYLYYWLQYNKQVFESIAFGSTIKTIGLGFFKRLRIAVPALAEQQVAATVLLQSDGLLSTTKTELAKLRAVKQGLMEDLLTGRVRVTVEGA
ncbi:restriction endonuclease subunit S [Micromonospora tulbaghiae]|uniref:restriction endonuclease subunit S n=1 Tax=Micromonospora tulbaghiae TaxID=479978 RepID=UPI0033C80068